MFNIRILSALLLIAIVSLCVFPAVAVAATTPSSGSFFYTAYDIAVNKIQKGPIGFLAGWVAIGAGIFFFIKGSYVAGLMSVIGGAVLLSLDSTVVSIGAIF